ncbi:unnamed protein product [Hymenolepis diminuta]|uniref:Uncharacterized protein n=1 Tax=Hymenolepis diminuta TaxID=6216 RepID=A0A564Y5U3_HYMDI|nr:unnamed protein product [Hymenolepis diminuta]
MEMMLWMKRPAEGGFLQVVSKRMTSTRNTNRDQDAQTLNYEQLQVAIDEKPICTTRELSKTFHISHMIIHREMKAKRKKVSKATKWAPHDLSEINRQQPVMTSCVSLRSRELRSPFSHPIITYSDEKGSGGSLTTMLNTKDSG